MRKPFNLVQMNGYWYFADENGFPLRGYGCWMLHSNAFKALQDHQNKQYSVYLKEQAEMETEEGKQSRTESLIEQCLSTASGFIVSFLLWTLVVVPLWQLPVQMHENLMITGLFTAVSIARGYFWRRFFANSIHKQIHKWLKEKSNEGI